MTRATRSSARAVAAAGKKEAAAAEKIPKAKTTKKAAKALKSKIEKKPPAPKIARNKSKKAIGGTLTVMIEACKSWNAFKIRANKIATAVGNKAEVKINAEKPGKGNFVVRVGDNIITELIGMKRPFPPLKALDMDQVCADVMKAIEA